MFKVIFYYVIKITMVCSAVIAPFIDAKKKCRGLTAACTAILLIGTFGSLAACSDGEPDLMNSSATQSTLGEVPLSEEGEIQNPAESEEAQNAANGVIEPKELERDVSVYTSPAVVNPEQEWVDFVVANKGSVPVTFPCYGFSISAYDGEGFVTVREAARGALYTVEPDSSYYLRIPLTGELLRENTYAISLTVTRGDQSYTFTAEYEVAQDTGGDEIPEMSAEYQAYYDHYLSTWGLENPFRHSFTEADYLPTSEVDLYLVFSSCYRLDHGERAPRLDSYPADLVESTIQKRFLWTSEEIRGAFGTVPQEFGNWYDPESSAYYFHGDYGGGSNFGIVTGARHQDGLLILDCDWYNVEGAPSYSHTVTIREDGECPVYVANQVVPWRGPSR